MAVPPVRLIVLHAETTRRGKNPIHFPSGAALQVRFVGAPSGVNGIFLHDDGRMDFYEDFICAVNGEEAHAVPVHKKWRGAVLEAYQTFLFEEHSRIVDLMVPEKRAARPKPKRKRVRR